MSKAERLYYSRLEYNFPGRNRAMKMAGVTILLSADMLKAK